MDMLSGCDELQVSPAEAGLVYVFGSATAAAIEGGEKAGRMGTEVIGTHSRASG